jgi:hypothetical protein
MSSTHPRRLDLDVAELNAITEEARAKGMCAELLSKLEAVFDTIIFISAEVQRQGTTIRRLRRMMFGASTEKTRHVCGQSSDDGQASSSSDSASPEATREAATDQTAPSSSGSSGSDAGPQQQPKRKGHGRQGAASYPGAERVPVQHASLRAGQACPSCERGKLYQLPARRARLRPPGGPAESAAGRLDARLPAGLPALLSAFRRGFDSCLGQHVRDRRASQNGPEFSGGGMMR